MPKNNKIDIIIREQNLEVIYQMIKFGYIANTSKHNKIINML